MNEPAATVRSWRGAGRFRSRSEVGQEDLVVAQRDARVGAGDVAVVGKQDVAALAAEHDRFAEQREGRAVDVAADDDGEPAPEARVRGAHDLGAVLERLGRRDDLEAQQLLADAEDVPGLQRLFGWSSCRNTPFRLCRSRTVTPSGPTDSSAWRGDR